MDKPPTPAHQQKETICLVENVPAHDPREGDPQYHRFNEIRDRWKKAGKLVCSVCGKDEAGSGAPIEVHHNLVEFAFQGDVDWAKFAARYPQLNIKSQADLDAFVEDEMNFLPLCKLHHTGPEGIHCIHYPAWQLLGVLKDGIQPPEIEVPHAGN
jgi:hypothetical protein